MNNLAEWAIAIGLFELLAKQKMDKLEKIRKTALR